MTVQFLSRPHINMPDGTMSHLFSGDHVNRVSTYTSTRSDRERVLIIDGEMWDQLGTSPNIWGGR